MKSTPNSLTPCSTNHSAAAKLSDAYHWTRFFGGIPSRLFLMLVGVSIALRFEAQLAARAVPAA